MKTKREDQSQSAAGKVAPVKQPRGQGSVRPALAAPTKGPPVDSGEPGGGRGRVDVTGIIPEGVRIDPDFTEGHPGYEESGDSEIIPAERLPGKTGRGKGDRQNPVEAKKPALAVTDLAAVVGELIEVLHLQARELEKLIAHVEQVTARFPEESQMSVIRSSLSGLHVRIQKLRGDAMREGNASVSLSGK